MKLTQLFRAHFGATRPSAHQAAEFAQAEIIKTLERVLEERKHRGEPYSKTIGIQEAVELIKAVF